MSKGLRYVYPLLLGILAGSALADPEQDHKALTEHYRTLFPKLTLQDYADGVYAIDPGARQSWRAIEEFPPYEWALEEGKTLFSIPFSNGAHYADCLPNRGIGIAQLYPKWNSETGEVVTLAKALNDCRERNGETPLPYQKGEIASLLAYLASTSRGKALAIEIPDSDPRALAAYQAGKAFYYERRGQLNFSCATCHVQNAGKRLRSEVLSPSLGHTSHWPVYRLKWGETGTLHRRFAECLKQVRAESPGAQSAQFRNLEYFLSYIGNGIPINGPSIRK
ncbi:MAG: sulfur oxidation c-type cytochrome SoxA [Gammaproteobacteria bacterium]|jgi:sulfur-oxidizing protein SoxA|nr:sulfur oxidation c-type cytochrome SoxA [Gammaproteobacteria bacterium]